MTLLQPKDSTQESLINSPTSTRFLWAASFTAALTAFHFGYAISSINVPSQVFTQCSYLIGSDGPSQNLFFTLHGCFHVEKEFWGFVGMGLPLGGWIGGITGPSIVKKFQLRNAILLLNIPAVLGYLFMALSANLWMLILGRILLGFTSGTSSVIVPMYLSSITPLHSRGFFTNFFQLFLCTGVMIAEMVSYAGDLGRHLWRWRFGFFLPGLFVICLQLISYRIFGALPETPNELEASGQLESASSIRQKLGISSGQLQESQNSQNVHGNIKNDLKPDIIMENPTETSLLNLLTFKIQEARKSAILGIIIHAGQQISGVSAIFFYSTMIISGRSTSASINNSATLPPPSLIPFILTFINVLMTVVSVWLLDRTGRRPLALFSVAGSAISLLALSLTISNFPSISPLLLYSFVTCFAVGLGPIPWMITPEIFPSKWPLTSAAISICVSANWIVNILVTGIFPALTKIFSQQWIFLFFAISSSLLFIFLHQFLPETKGRPSNFI